MIAEGSTANGPVTAEEDSTTKGSATASKSVQALIAEAELPLMSARSPELISIEVHSPCPAPPRSYQTMRKGYRPAWETTKSTVSFAGPPLWNTSGAVLGSTRYHDIVPAVERLEIGYTWYAARAQRSAVNTTAKLLLMQHAFETLGAQLVGWRTDNYNFASQRAIERLGARKDGVLRHHALRRDGTVRDTVMYSLAAGEWPEVKAHLLWQLTRPR